MFHIMKYTTIMVFNYRLTRHTITAFTWKYTTQSQIQIWLQTFTFRFSC